ncbi:MAG: acetyl/propionyl/methylcrotonyl-CoA carboxylase subunit alpha [Burkholderiaceae bacterium]|nr:acetyl/propionyl/methylcrotonyl-CoA carboxylase subunit alpha [Burkholderiaceae bacterium]
MFKKILIANRGEIACRVIKTAQKMGIKTVAVYSEADRDARHVSMADEAVFIGAAPSKDSYLVVEKIIAACKQTGAEAVHPGYGFLSENSDFCDRLEKEGIIFIGPKKHAIESMGDKIASKKLAMAAGVSTIPGYTDVIKSPEQAVEIANGIGYPVMIKASAGGGGKGLRVAFNATEAHEGFQSCTNEARNSFGDDRVFIEKFIEEPRHIEIQVLGDAHGNLVYLWERECSLQRRHQKVIEEAPSPFLDAATRKAMGEQAVALARAVQYQSAGTVEFVVGKGREFYFLEMNTRLQVEHPVTEFITGVDLVEQMIRVAAGEKLSFGQDELKLDGWAIECRVNAEDAARNFLPSTGRLVTYRPPEEIPGKVRVDTGVYEGAEISMFYDPMIAKLIVHAPTRLEAIASMRDALNSFAIRGVSSNIAFHAALLQNPGFVSGTFNTGLIGEQYPKGFVAADLAHDEPQLLITVAAFIHRKHLERNASTSGQLPGHHYVPENDFIVLIGGESHPVTVSAFNGGMRIKHDNKDYDLVSDWKFGQLIIRGTVNGEPFSMQAERVGVDYRLSHWGTQADIKVLGVAAAKLQALMLHKAPPDLSRFLLSPMPGLLTELVVGEGQVVKAGEKLATIEAMKMENILRAEQDCVIGKLMAKPGESLAVNQAIIEFGGK